VKFCHEVLFIYKLWLKNPLTIHNKKGLEGKLMHINSTEYVSTMAGLKDSPSNS
jgi:hypothetical protein